MERVANVHSFILFDSLFNNIIPTFIYFLFMENYTHERRIFSGSFEIEKWAKGMNQEMLSAAKQLPNGIITLSKISIKSLVKQADISIS